MYKREVSGVIPCKQKKNVFNWTFISDFGGIHTDEKLNDVNTSSFKKKTLSNKRDNRAKKLKIGLRPGSLI